MTDQNQSKQPPLDIYGDGSVEIYSYNLAPFNLGSASEGETKQSTPSGDKKIFNMTSESEENPKPSDIVLDIQEAQEKILSGGLRPDMLNILAATMTGPHTKFKLNDSDHTDWLFKISARFFSSNHKMAVAYLHRRHKDFTKLMKSLVWTYQTNKVVHITTPLVHGLSMNHELSPGELHASPCWGEIYDSRAEDTILFPTMETAMAYILARWW